VMRRGGGKGSAASEERSGRRGSGGVEESRTGSAGAVEKTNLTSGPHVAAGGYRGGAKNGRCESKKKIYFCN
jgi:hypothetical protein